MNHFTSLVASTMVKMGLFLFIIAMFSCILVLKLAKSSDHMKLLKSIKFWLFLALKSARTIGNSLQY